MERILLVHLLHPVCESFVDNIPILWSRFASHELFSDSYFLKRKLFPKPLFVIVKEGKSFYFWNSFGESCSVIITKTVHLFLKKGIYKQLERETNSPFFLPAFLQFIGNWYPIRKGLCFRPSFVLLLLISTWG